MVPIFEDLEVQPTGDIERDVNILPKSIFCRPPPKNFLKIQNLTLTPSKMILCSLILCDAFLKISLLSFCHNLDNACLFNGEMEIFLKFKHASLEKPSFLHEFNNKLLLNNCSGSHLGWSVGAIIGNLVLFSSIVKKIQFSWKTQKRCWNL